MEWCQKKSSSLEKQSQTIASHDSIEVQAHHLFSPVTLSKPTNIPTSASGCVVCTPSSFGSVCSFNTKRCCSYFNTLSLRSLRGMVFKEIITWLPELTKGLVLCFNFCSPHYFRLKQLFDATDLPLPVISFGPTAFFQLHVVVEKNPKAQHEGLSTQEWANETTMSPDKVLESRWERRPTTAHSAIVVVDACLSLLDQTVHNGFE